MNRTLTAALGGLALIATLGLSAAPATAASTLPVHAVTASGDDGDVPANAIDGNLSTRWSDEGDGAWIQFDLGADTTIGSVDIAWYQGDTRTFTFDVETATSAAPTTWHVALSRKVSSGTTASYEPYDITDVTGRYVRIVGHGNTKNDWTSISDVQILGADGTGTGGGSGTCPVPAQVLNLTNWKITLPTGPSEDPTEIGQPQLATYSVDPYFETTGSTCDGVRFRAPVNGVTTSGSNYPRSELREMTNNGTTEASWSSGSGTSTLDVKEAFITLPSTKPQVVGAQIHDASDDISVFRLEGSDLYVTKGDDAHYALATSSYKLGTVYEAKFVVSGNQIKAYYNGTLVTTISESFSGAYFKAGAYTQANCTNSSPCSSSNYGEVVIHSLTVSHT